MDPLTHAISGAVLARASARLPASRRLRITPGRRPSARGWIVAVTLAALFPDIDFVVGAVDPLVYLHHHRGVTHSFIALPFWALGLGWLFARAAGAPQQWPGYAVAAALGIAIHIVGDLITPYGTMILAPISRETFEFGTTFIIDPWLSGLLVVGLLISRRRWPEGAAQLTLAVVAVYIGLQAVLMTQARTLAVAHAHAHGLAAEAAAVYPQPPWPAHWKLVVARGDGFDTARVSLLRRAPPAPADDGGLVRQFLAEFQPAHALQWTFVPGLDGETDPFVMSAWRHPALGYYREFARYPVVHDVRDDPRARCAWFRDLRFDLPGRPPPFRYGMCFDPATEAWRRDQIGVW
jgi:inner membrane protein